MSFLSASTKSCILITGAGKGIGLALAKNFISLGHEVIITEREQENLEKAKSACPQLITCQADLKNDNGRKNLIDRIKTDYPQCNVLINNAGENNFPPPLRESQESDWTEHHMKTILVNLVAPIHLSILLLPHFASKKDALIVNVTDVAAYCPVARYPTYSATKAGLHNLTLSLRHQCKDTSIKVVEMIPPTVETPKLPTELKGQAAVNPDDFARSAIDQLLNGLNEITYHDTDKVVCASRDELDQTFKEWNSAEAQQGKLGVEGEGQKQEGKKEMM